MGMKALVLFLSLVLWNQSTWATEIPHEVFTTREGLPSPDVYCVYRDAQSYLWICTDRGVSRYNGYEFENFTTSDGLTHHTIFGIFTDPDQNLWMQCYDGSLAIWKASKQKFEPFWHNETLQPNMNNQWVAHVAFEEEWVYLIPGFRSDTFFQANRFDSTMLKPFPANDFFTETYAIDSLNIRLRRSGNEIILQYRTPKGYWHLVRRTHQLSQKRFLISIEGRLLLIDLLRQECREVFRCSLTIQDVRMHHNRLYVAHLDGLHVLDPKTWEVLDHWFPRNRITWITPDIEGNLWLGVEKRGVIKINSLTEVQLYPKLQAQLQEEEDLESVAGFGNYMVLGTNENRLLVIDSAGKMVHQRGEISQRKFGPRPVISQLTTSGDTVTSNCMVRVFEANGKVESIVKASPIATSTMEFGLALMDGRYLRFSLKNVKIGRLTKGGRFLEQQSCRLPNRVFSMVEAPDGTIWLASHRSLFRIKDYDLSTLEEMNAVLGLPAVSIRSMAVRPNSELWLGTLGHGLLWLRNGRIERIDQQKGLAGNTINSVCMQGDSVVWSGGNNGLSKLRLLRNRDGSMLTQITNYSPADGLPSSYIKQLTFRNGRLWGITESGLFSCLPQNLRTSFAAPKLHLVSVRQGAGEWVTPGTTLPYDQNTLTFSFLGISQLKPVTSPFYAYRLWRDEQPGPWRETNDRSVWLSSLPAGDFRLELKAVNKNGVYSSTISFPFSIHPQMIDTWWFRVSVLLTLGAVLYYFFWIRIQRIRSKIQYNRQLRDAEIRVKQAELSLLRNQMNPHFIFNALTSVQKYILKKDTLRSIKYLSRFSLLMRKTLEYSSTELISLADELAFIRNYLEIEKTRFQDLFDYHIEVDEALEPEGVAVPALLLQPVLENCVKHAFRDMQSGGEIQVRFEVLNNTKNQLLVTILDNGRGLHLASSKVSDRKHPSFGLGIVKERIEIMNLRTQSSAQFTIQNRTPNGVASGTLAKFELPWRTFQTTR